MSMKFGRAIALLLCIVGTPLWADSNVQIRGVGSPHPTESANAWWKHAVIYEIYPRSFQDTNDDGVGDLVGVTRRLGYLKELGIDAIWLTPFFPSPNADFGYDVSNYTDVASEYGTMADWDALVLEARKRGIRVLVDLVLNHSSDQHPWFKESRSSVGNPKRDWYVWRQGGAGNAPPTHWPSIFGGDTWTLDPITNQWYYHIFLPQQPDLNWANPGLRKAMFDVARFWLRHGAAGFRLDATPYLFEDPAFPEDLAPKSGPPAWLKPYNSGRPENHEVLRGLRATLDEFPGDRVLLGESTTANIQGLAAVYGKNHDEINLPMDFLFGNLTKLDASAFKKQVDDAQLQLGGQTPVFFFSSHDHSRQWSTFGDGVHNDQIAKLTAALTLTQRGTVLIYYGEEIGMADMAMSELKAVPLGPHRPRADDRDPARTPMQWAASNGAGFTHGAPWLPIQSRASKYNVASEQEDPSSIYSWYKQLLNLRHTNPVFRDGTYIPLDSGNPDVLAFARSTKDGHGALIVLNASNREQQVAITGWSAKVPTFGKAIMSSPTAPAPATTKFRVSAYGVLIVGLRLGR
jgi:alpha-glucosidase